MSLRFISIAIALCFLVSPHASVHAQVAAEVQSDALSQLDALGGQEGAQFGQALAPQMVAGMIIQRLLEVVGMTMILLFVYGGYLRVTAQGEEQKIEKSTKTMEGAVIGLLIIISSYGITRFVSARIYNAATGTATYEIQETVGPADPVLFFSNP